MLARISEDELEAFLRGHGYEPLFFTGGFDDEDTVELHDRFAEVLDTALDRIAELQHAARVEDDEERKSLADDRAAHAEGLDGPEGGRRQAGRGHAGARTRFRSRETRENAEHRAAARGVAAELPARGALRRVRAPAPRARRATARGRPADERQPARERRPAAPRPAPPRLPRLRRRGAEAGDRPRARRPACWASSSATSSRGTRRRSACSARTRRSRTASATSSRSRTASGRPAIEPTDENLARDGRVVEMLSEHMCQGWLEGYLLTGRHGLFNCYEAFIHIVDSMFNQHAKWLKVTRDIPWRRPVASLNYLLSSHVWRQDHNGFSHQDPGFIDHVVNKQAEVVRVYLPPDANTLLSVADHCLRSRHYVNVIVAGKQPALQYLSIDDAIVHCTRGLGIWEWASNDEGAEPDVVLGVRRRRPDARDARRGGDPARAAARPEGAGRQRRRPHAPPARERSIRTGSRTTSSTALFTHDKPVVFAYHGYPWLIHRLTYRRANHGNLHVRGYKEEGTTTTPFDMVMLNDLDRFHLVLDVIDRVPGLGAEVRRTCARRWPTDGCGARLDARARRGPSRRPRLGLAVLSTILVVNAGSTSLKLHLVERRGRATVSTASSRRTRSATASSTAARASASRSRSTTTSSRGIEELRPLAPLHNEPALRGDRRRARGATRGSPRRRLRHGVPPDHPCRGGDLRDPGAAGERSGGSGATASTASRSSRSPSRVDAERLVVCHLGGGCSVTAVLRRRVGRHDDGVHAARGRADGDALGLGRPRRAPLRPAASAACRSRSSTARSSTNRVSLRSAGSTTRSASASSPTRRAGGGARWRWRSAASTCSPSRAASARTARTSRAAVAERLAFLGDIRVEVVEAREELVIAQAVRRALAQ